MGPPLRGIWNVILFNRHRRSSERGSPRTATPTALTGGNPSPATRAARSGGPYGEIGADLFYRNRSVIQRLLPPLPPSYEEGALRRERARIFGTFPITYLVGAAHVSARGTFRDGDGPDKTVHVGQRKRAAVGGGPYGVVRDGSIIDARVAEDGDPYGG